MSTAATPRRLPSWMVDAARTILRIVTGLMFMQHGAQKLFGLLPMPNMPPMGAPAMFSKMWIAGVLEFFGGALIALGLFTRPVAFLLCGEMAVAYFTVHAPRGLFPILNMGELAVLYCFVYLYFFAAGAGPYSIDGWWGRRRL